MAYLQNRHLTGAKLLTPSPSGPSRTASSQQTPWTFNTGSLADTSNLT
jgi:hypothetical protein